MDVDLTGLLQICALSWQLVDKIDFKEIPSIFNKTKESVCWKRVRVRLVQTHARIFGRKEGGGVGVDGVSWLWSRAFGYPLRVARVGSPENIEND